MFLCFYVLISACGGEYTGDTGLIRSPYNPEPYPGNRECIYVISQPVGKAVLLNFTFFDIEQPRFTSTCLFDYVEVSVGGSGGGGGGGGGEENVYIN